MKFKILLFGLFLITSLGLKAQEIYEYGVVTYQDLGSKKYKLVQSFNDEPKVETGTVSSEFVNVNFEPVNHVLNELSKQGWTVYNSNYTPVIHWFYLKRKKKE